jgi:hypothetical protein
MDWTSELRGCLRYCGVVNHNNDVVDLFMLILKDALQDGEISNEQIDLVDSTRS